MFHGFVLIVAFALDGLGGRCVWGKLDDFGDVGGDRSTLLDLFESIRGMAAAPKVLIDALSSNSEISDNIERSVYEFRIEDTRVVEEAE